MKNYAYTFIALSTIINFVIFSTGYTYFVVLHGLENSNFWFNTLTSMVFYCLIVFFAWEKNIISPILVLITMVNLFFSFSWNLSVAFSLSFPSNINFLLSFLNFFVALFLIILWLKKKLTSP